MPNNVLDSPENNKRDFQNSEIHFNELNHVLNINCFIVNIDFIIYFCNLSNN